MKKKLPKKKVKRTTLKRKADVLFGKLIRSRGACERCLKETSLQTSHVISRSNLHLRYDVRNALCFCGGCHMWWHKEPLEAITWYHAVFAKDYRYLMKEKNVYEKIDYEKIINNLKMEVEKL